MKRFAATCGLWLISVLVPTLCAAETLPPYIPDPVQIVRPDYISAQEIPNGPEALHEPRSLVRSLNGVWKCSGLQTSATEYPDDIDLDKGLEAPAFDDSQWDRIDVPLNWYRKYPTKQSAKEPYVKGWYRTTWMLSTEELKNRRVILRFDVAGYDATVFLNGAKAGRHLGDFTPFEMDVTEYARAGKNVLAVRVLTDQGTHSAQPMKVRHAYGSQWAPDNIRGGLWQNVTLLLEPQIRITRALVTPNLNKGTVEVDYTITNTTQQSIQTHLNSIVTPALRADSGLITGVSDNTITLAPGENTGTFAVPLDKPICWNVGKPYLYFLTLRVKDGGATISSHVVRFGYRDMKSRSGRFYLNGRELYLFGQNVSSIKYGGHGRSDFEESQRFEKEVRQFLSVGVVIARTAHMPLLPALLDTADENGLMIYHEWAWSFTDKLDESAFARNNLREVREFVEASYNHPSVSIWSMGNEVHHGSAPAISKLLDAQVRLVRALDKSGRPVSTFSGAGGWYSYGETRLETDVHDMHNYTGLYDPWTTMADLIDKQYQGELRIYGEEKNFSRPLIAWENVGFSWGIRPDTTFRRGDIRQYLDYLGKPTNWGAPNGVGFIGVAPLYKALSPDFGLWAQTLYGHRIFEVMRIKGRFAGFAPWFAAIPASTLWNQPCYPSLHSDGLLFPRNLFLGETTSWNLAIANDGDKVLSHGRIELTLLHADGRTITPISVENISDVLPHSKMTKKCDITIPVSITPGVCQLRLTIRTADGQDAGRNYYDLFVQQRDITSRAITLQRHVYVLDTGARKNVAAADDLLTGFQIPFTHTSTFAKLDPGSLVIVPPEIHEDQKISLGNNAELNTFLRERGGILLILEQKNLSSTFPGNQSLTSHSATFVDMVTPNHPIFNGLDDWNFDTWANPDHGFVIYNSFVPPSMNSLAIKGPTFSRTNLGSAIVEATEGKGRVIFSQLAACQTRQIDCVAATYLYNLVRYAAGSTSFWPDAQPLIENRRDYVMDAQSAIFIDLSQHANTSFSDEIDNDGKGGWTDQGRNDYRMMPLGRQVAAGIPFMILDPEKNHGRSCLVLRGSERPGFPAKITGIKVGQRLSRLFFMHTAAWGGSGFTGAYRIHYTDGVTLDYDVNGCDNIGDWWAVTPLPSAKIGFLNKNSTEHEVGTYVAEWNNPRIEVAIESIDFLSALTAREGQIDWMPAGTPVPVLIAITGEPASNKVESLLGTRFTVAAGATEPDGKTRGQVETLRAKDRTTLKISFTKTAGQECPKVRIAFNPSNLDKQYTYLSFWIKSSDRGSVQFVLGEKTWKGTYTGEVMLKDDGQWHKYRLSFERDLVQWGDIDMQKLRGELFVFSRSKLTMNSPRPATSFEIRDILFE